MWLRNWEHNATSGLPIAGATVEARAASLVSPNTGPVVASTTTDVNGMWEFTSLADSAHDIKITYTGNVWWHKGLTKHNVDAIFYTTPTPNTDNFLRNAGFEGGPAGPWTVTNVNQAVFGSWSALNGTGSSAVLSRELTTKSTDSDVAAKIVQTKVSGSLQLYQNVLNFASMRSKQVTLSVQVHQSVAASVRAYIGDSVGTTFSATSATTGSFVTLTVTRTIDGAATVVQAGISVDLSATVYVDNLILALGAVAATYRPEYFQSYSLTNDLLATDAVDARILADNAVDTNAIAAGAVTATKLGSGAALSNLGYTPVNRVGDTMSGDLIFTDGIGVQLGAATGTKGRLYDVSGSQTVIRMHNNALGVWKSDLSAAILAITSTGVAVTGTLSATGVASATDFTIGGTSVKARSIHTGTQAPATISPQGSGSGLGADTLDGQEGSWYQDRANHTGTQLAATISNLAGTVATLAAASATTAGDSAQLGGVGAANYLRTNVGAASMNTVTWTVGSGAGTLTINGNFSVVGSKFRAALGRDGRRRLFSALESTEPYFEDFGRGELIDGEARVQIPEDFANHVDTEDEYYVFLTPESDAALYIANRTNHYFTVRALNGDAEAFFAWRIVARQGDMEPDRLPLVAGS